MRNGLRRLIPIILTVVIIGLVIWGVVSVARTFFGGNSKPTPSASPVVKVNAGKQALTNTASDDSVLLNVRGPLVADENYHTYTIVISPSSRVMTTFQGYANKTFETNQLTNTTQGYEQLVYALAKAKLMDGTPLTGSANDERGVCATGTVYEFEVLQGGTTIQKLWTSTCVGSPGSLKANLVQVANLFESQIPDFAARIEKININA